MSEKRLLQSALYTYCEDNNMLTDFNFSKEHVGKSEQIAWEGCEDAITEGV